MEIKSLQELVAELLIGAVTLFINACELLKLTNEQFFIDFEDKLNKLSVKDHNKKED